MRERLGLPVSGANGKPTAQEGLWVHGGNLACRATTPSNLALPLKARMAGIPTPVCKRAEVHHTE